MYKQDLALNHPNKLICHKTSSVQLTSTHGLSHAKCEKKKNETTVLLHTPYDLAIEADILNIYIYIYTFIRFHHGKRKTVSHEWERSHNNQKVSLSGTYFANGSRDSLDPDQVLRLLLKLMIHLAKNKALTNCPSSLFFFFVFFLQLYSYNLCIFLSFYLSFSLFLFIYQFQNTSSFLPIYFIFVDYFCLPKIFFLLLLQFLPHLFSFFLPFFCVSFYSFFCVSFLYQFPLVFFLSFFLSFFCI